MYDVYSFVPILFFMFVHPHTHTQKKKTKMAVKRARAYEWLDSEWQERPNQTPMTIQELTKQLAASTTHEHAIINRFREHGLDFYHPEAINRLYLECVAEVTERFLCVWVSGGGGGGNESPFYGDPEANSTPTALLRHGAGENLWSMLRKVNLLPVPRKRPRPNHQQQFHRLIEEFKIAAKTLPNAQEDQVHVTSFSGHNLAIPRERYCKDWIRLMTLTYKDMGPNEFKLRYTFVEHPATFVRLALDHDLPCTDAEKDSIFNFQQTTEKVLAILRQYVPMDQLLCWVKNQSGPIRYKKGYDYIHSYHYIFPMVVLPLHVAKALCQLVHQQVPAIDMSVYKDTKLQLRMLWNDKKHRGLLVNRPCALFKVLVPDKEGSWHHAELEPISPLKAAINCSIVPNCEQYHQEQHHTKLLKEIIAPQPTLDNQLLVVQDSTPAPSSSRKLSGPAYRTLFYWIPQLYPGLVVRSAKMSHDAQAIFIDLVAHESRYRICPNKQQDPNTNVPYHGTSTNYFILKPAATGLSLW